MGSMQQIITKGLRKW